MRPKQQFEESQRLLRRAQASAYEFLKTELVLAVTFTNAALSSQDVERRERNVDNALKALSAVKRFSSRLDLQEEQTKELSQKIREVHHLLAGVGNKRGRNKR